MKAKTDIIWKTNVIPAGEGKAVRLDAGQRLKVITGPATVLACNPPSLTVRRGSWMPS